MRQPVRWDPIRFEGRPQHIEVRRGVGHAEGGDAVGDTDRRRLPPITRQRFGRRHGWPASVNKRTFMTFDRGGEKRVTMERDPLTGQVIGSAIEVHRALGPGLLESTYEQCLAHELSLREISFRLQVELPVQYKGVRLECGYRVDVLVEEQLILELKSVEQVKGIHAAQLLTYMKLARVCTGLILNFNVEVLKDGITRFKL